MQFQLPNNGSCHRSSLAVIYQIGTFLAEEIISTNVNIKVLAMVFNFCFWKLSFWQNSKWIKGIHHISFVLLLCCHFSLNYFVFVLYTIVLYVFGRVNNKKTVHNEDPLKCIWYKTPEAKSKIISIILYRTFWQS